MPFIALLEIISSPQNNSMAHSLCLGFTVHLNEFLLQTRILAMTSFSDRNCDKIGVHSCVLTGSLLFWLMRLVTVACMYIHTQHLLSVAAYSLQIALDSIENIRTVAALGVEEVFFHQYKENVKAPYK